jgi:hypothetical protein
MIFLVHSHYYHTHAFYIVCINIDLIVDFIVKSNVPIIHYSFIVLSIVKSNIPIIHYSFIVLSLSL